MKANEEEAEGRIFWTTPPCGVCGHTGFIEVTLADFQALARNIPAAEVLVDYGTLCIEQASSGTHPGCWDLVWSEQEEATANIYADWSWY